jgi:hypothetical protein
MKAELGDGNMEGLLMSTAETPLNDLEALLVEQARLMARELRKVADAAPHGRVLAAVETAAVPAARALARTAVEALLQQQAESAEKKGCPAAPAPTAAPPEGPNGAPPAAS